MNRNEKYKKVLEGLRLALRRMSDERTHSRRMRFNAVPFTTLMIYNGVNVAEAMVPDVPDDPQQCRTAFDTWAVTLLDRDECPYEALGRCVNAKVVDWLKQWETEAEQTTMLLWALGHAEGATVDYDEGSMLVEHEGERYGINRGVIVSPFSTGKPLPIANPEVILNDNKPRRTFSARLITMYRAAYQSGDEHAQALLAMATAYPRLSLWQEILKGSKYPTPPTSVVLRWSKILMSYNMPFQILYKEMVPMWMASTTFRDVIGNTAGGRNLAMTTRQKIINRMYMHFYKRGAR